MLSLVHRYQSRARKQAVWQYGNKLLKLRPSKVNGGNGSESNRSAAFRPLSGFEDHAHHRMRYAPGFSLPARHPR